MPIRNEAENLPRCLASVAWADEIFVVDSQSTDGSPRIAEELGARVVQFEFNGTWPKKKNWALENLPFRNEWVFILDADEVLPPEAEVEFRAAIAGAGATAGLLDQPAFHVHGPLAAARLLSELESAPLSALVRPLRETDRGRDRERRQRSARARRGAGTNRPVALRNGSLRFPSVEVFVEKHNRYSNWEARVACRPKDARRAQRNCKVAPVAQRRRLKQLSQRLPFRPLLRFLYIYVWQRGFLDGREGYYFARLHAFYEFLSVAKTYELRNTASA